MNVKKEVTPITDFLQPSASTSSASQEEEAQANDQVVIPPPPPPPPTQSSSEQSKELVSVPRNSLSTYVTNDEVLESEILWAMKTVESH